MAIAMTFPGQGSQSVGMGKDWAENFPVAKQVFDEVDDALSQKLTDIMFDGEDDELTLTANAQPALMAVSMAIVRVLEDQGVNLGQSIQYVAGHSLGEYSALCASGMFSIADTAKLLRVRGDAMQKAVPAGKGAMAAIIGLEHDVVATICDQVQGSGCCQIANDNGGGQLVISGSKAEVEKAAEMASGNGAKRALMLPVSAPFHSALMAPAADAMKEALADVKTSGLSVPLIANVTAEKVIEPNKIKSLLVEQVTGQVRWRESVSWLAGNQTQTLFEVGAGKVLTGLARRIDRSLNGIALNSPQDLDSALEILAS